MAITCIFERLEGTENEKLDPLTVDDTSVPSFADTASKAESRRLRKSAISCARNTFKTVAAGASTARTIPPPATKRQTVNQASISICPRIRKYMAATTCIASQSQR